MSTSLLSIRDAQTSEAVILRGHGEQLRWDLDMQELYRSTVEKLATELDEEVAPLILLINIVLKECVKLFNTRTCVQCERLHYVGWVVYLRYKDGPTYGCSASCVETWLETTRNTSYVQQQFVSRLDRG